MKEEDIHEGNENTGSDPSTEEKQKGNVDAGTANSRKKQRTRISFSGWFEGFLWNLSGHQYSIIRETQVDRYKASVVGSLLLMVGIFATLAWTFFFSTVIHQVWLSLSCGLVAGFFILLFDRALISSLSYGKKNFWALSFRFLLALLLGVFLSQPIILKLYEPDIKREAALLLDKKNQDRRVELEKVYSSELQLLKLSRDRIYQSLDEKHKQVITNEEAFRKEMDGTAGTGRWGYNTVSKKKEGIYLSELEEYKTMQARSEPELKWINARLDSLQNQINRDFDRYVQANLNEGFLVQVEALQSLLTKDPTHTLRNRYLLLLVILTLIELSALLAKLLLDTSSYKARVDFLVEQEIRKAEMDKEILFSKLDVYKKLTLEREQKNIEEFFSKTDAVSEDKLKEITEEWAQSKDQTYKTAWSTLWKKLMLHDTN